MLGICTSLAVGLVTSTIVIFVVFALPFPTLKVVYLYSAYPMAWVVSMVLPIEFWSWVFPEGGSVPAAILVFAGSGWLQNCILFSFLTYRFLRYREGRNQV